MKTIKFISGLFFLSILFFTCKPKCGDPRYLYLDQNYKSFIPYKGKEHLKFVNITNKDTFTLSARDYQTTYTEMYDYGSEGPCPNTYNAERCSLDMESKYGDFCIVLWYDLPTGNGGSFSPNEVSYNFFIKSRSTSNLNAVMKITNTGGGKDVTLNSTHKDTLTIGNKLYRDVYVLTDYWYFDAVYLNKEFGILRINDGSRDLIRIE